MSYPISWLGQLWVQGAWWKSRLSSTQQSTLKRKRVANDAVLSWFHLIALLLFCALLAGVQDGAYYVPWFLLALGVLIPVYLRNERWSSFSALSGFLFLLTLMCAFLRFSLQAGNCTTLPNEQQVSDNCTDTHIMCFSHCDIPPPFQGNFCNPIRTNPIIWDQCDGTDRNVIYITVVNFFAFLIAQIAHFELFPFKRSSVPEANSFKYAGLGDAPSIAVSPTDTTLSPCLQVTVRTLDVPSLLGKRSEHSSTSFRATFATYNAILALAHDPKVVAKKVELIKILTTLAGLQSPLMSVGGGTWRLGHATTFLGSAFTWLLKAIPLSLSFVAAFAAILLLFYLNVWLLSDTTSALQLDSDDLFFLKITGFWRFLLFAIGAGSFASLL